MRSMELHQYDKNSIREVTFGADIIPHFFEIYSVPNTADETYKQ